MKTHPSEPTIENIHSLSTADKKDALYFWGHRPLRDGGISKGCLSQWWKCQFSVSEDTYTSAEQYMMAEKALLFGDEECRQKILGASDPKETKALGRRIKNFDEDIWLRQRYPIVVAGNLAKFSQNEHLRHFLIATGDKTLVEASPVDSIWGVGLAADDPTIADPKNWKGLNLLGFALMEVRQALNKLEPQ